MHRRGEDLVVQAGITRQNVGSQYLTKLEEPAAEEDVTVVEVPAATVTVASLLEALRLLGTEP